MQSINYRKLLTGVRSTNVMLCTAIIIGFWMLLIVVIDHFVNFTLFHFKLLLIPGFIFYVVGMWIAVKLNGADQRV
jgi:hypothetical protein